MSNTPDYRPGEWKAICAVCGFQFYASELFLATAPGQQGMRVCRDDLDVRNPQDFIRPVQEKITPPWTSPDLDNITLPVSWANNSLWVLPWEDDSHVTISWSDE